MKAFALFAASFVTETASLPQWSWDTVSTWAFPGFVANGYFSQSEIELFSKFDMLDICAVDIRCTNGTNSTKKSPSHFNECPRGTEFVPNQEQALVEQSKALKASGTSVATSFPYIYWSCSEMWYESAHEFAKMPQYWARNDTGHPIICPKWQGSEMYAYNFSIPEVRDFFIEKVLSPILDAESVDGIFFDEFGNMPYIFCRDQGCSPERVAAAANGTLTLLDAVTRLISSKNKTAIVSTHTSTTWHPDFYNTYVETLKRNGGMRYFEYFCSDGSSYQSSCINDVMMLQSLGEKKIPAQVHAGFVEGDSFTYRLGAFLLGVSEDVYFSWGKNNDWSVTGFPWMVEYTYPLGPPLGAATNSTPFVWKRSFAHASVEVDFSTKNGTINWN